jgi:hypothetical protein
VPPALVGSPHLPAGKTMDDIEQAVSAFHAERGSEFDIHFSAQPPPSPPSLPTPAPRLPCPRCEYLYRASIASETDISSPAPPHRWLLFLGSTIYLFCVDLGFIIEWLNSLVLRIMRAGSAHRCNYIVSFTPTRRNFLHLMDL